MQLPPFFHPRARCPLSSLTNPRSTAKDVSSYVADSQKQEAKIAAMRAAGADEATIKKQEEVRVCARVCVCARPFFARFPPLILFQVLAEDSVALNDSRQRLAAAVDALRLLLESARAGGGAASESEEVRLAEEALAAATA